MKFFGLFPVVLLVLVVKNSLTECPERECECGEACVDEKRRWCSNYSNTKCSCTKGCLVYNHFLKPGTTRSAYCNLCHCPKDSVDGDAYCTLRRDCTPKVFIPGIHYPKWWPNNPNCPIW